MVEVEKEVVKQWKFYDCSTGWRDGSAALVRLAAGEKYQVGAAYISHFPKPAEKLDQPGEVCEGIQ